MSKGTNVSVWGRATGYCCGLLTSTIHVYFDLFSLHSLRASSLWLSHELPSGWGSACWFVYCCLESSLLCRGPSLLQLLFQSASSGFLPAPCLLLGVEGSLSCWIGVSPFPSDLARPRCSIMELKSRMSVGMPFFTLSRGSGRICFLTFPASRGSLHSLAHGPFLIFKTSRAASSNLCFCHHTAFSLTDVPLMKTL